MYKSGGITEIWMQQLNHKHSWKYFSQTEDNAYYTFSKVNIQNKECYLRVCNLYLQNNQPCLYQHKEERVLKMHVQSKKHLLLDTTTFIHLSTSAVSVFSQWLF